MRKMSGGSSTLATARMWSSMGDIVEGEDDTDEKRKVLITHVLVTHCIFVCTRKEVALQIC